MKVKSERKVKERLVDKIQGAVPLEDLLEWLWEDYGIKARDWETAKKALLARKEITARDLAVLLLEYGVEVESDWYE